MFLNNKDNCRLPECIKSFPDRCGVCSFSESPIILMAPCCNGLIYRRRGGGYMPRQRRALYRMHSYVLDNQTLWNQLPIIVRLESLQKQMLRFPNSKDFINMHILYSMIDYFRQINTPISARIQIGIVFTTFVARSSTTWNVKFSKN